MGALAKIRKGGKVVRDVRSHEGQMRASARKKLNRGSRQKPTPEGFAEVQKLCEEHERKMKADVARAIKPKPKPMEIVWVPAEKAWE